jgi:hypothetical protein
MLFPTVGAIELAKALLTMEPFAPLKDLHEDEVSVTSASGGGYVVLLVTPFYALQKVMRNKPEVATAIGASYTELLRKYSAISGFDQRMFTEGITSIDKVIADSGGDPRVAYQHKITDFLQTMSVKPPAHRITIEAMLFPGLFMDTISDLAIGFHTALTDSAMTNFVDLSATINGLNTINNQAPTR